MVKTSFGKFLFPILAILLLSGCASMATSKQQFVAIEEMVARRDFGGAITQLETTKDKYYQKKDQVIYYLDLGMLYHYNKQYAKSNEKLTMAEDAIEELYTKSVTRAATSMLLNDNVLAYDGEDYEDIYLNIFKALNYLKLDDVDAAFVEIRRVNNKLELLGQKYNNLADQMSRAKENKTKIDPVENKFHNDVLGRYLSMLLYAAEGKMDDARIDKEEIDKAWDMQSQIYNFGKPNINIPYHDKDNGDLSIMAFSGRSPQKKANTLYIHTEKDLIFIANSAELPTGKQQLEDLKAIPWEGVEKGYHFKFQLPYMEKTGSQVAFVKVIIDGSMNYKLDLLESLEQVALTTFEVKSGIIYLKTIVRSLTKGLFAAKRKQEMSKQIDNPLLGFAARLATDLAVDATENADLRLSRFFPAKASVTTIKLATGLHTVEIQYYGRNGQILFSDNIGEVNISPDKLNFVESYYLK